LLERLLGGSLLLTSGAE